MAKEKKSSPSKASKSFRLDEFLLDLGSRFGITGCVVISFIYVFIKYGTQQQKEEFIDKFFLFKVTESDAPYLVVIGLFIVLIFIFQGRVHTKRIKLKDERIEQLEIHVDNLENKLLDNKSPAKKNRP